MAAAWIAAIAAVAGTAMAGYQYASMPGPPKAPDLGAATRAGTEAEAATLADRRRLEAAAQQGTSTTYQVAKHKEPAQFIRVTQDEALHNQLDRSAWDAASEGPLPGGSNVLGHFSDFMGLTSDKPQYTYIQYKPEDWQPGGKYYKAGRPDNWVQQHLETRQLKVPAHTATADFTGYGTADVQGKLAQQNAQTVLDLQAKYGPQFIEEALKQQEQADPEGTAARKQSYALIQKMEAEHPDRPVAALLDSQVADQLHAGKNLDSVSDSVLKDAVAKAQAARGSSSSDPNLDFSAPLTTGLEGEARQMAAQQKATNWLASGQTPEDVEYRRRQAIEGDLGAFVNGRTPESQFPTLSGAQRGPAPFYQGTPLSGASSATGPAASNAAMSVWGQQLGYNSNQANPWMAGLSTLLSGINTYTNASTVPRTG